MLVQLCVKRGCIWFSWCHCIPKPHHLLPHLNPLVLLFWYRLTQAGRKPLNGCFLFSSCCDLHTYMYVMCVLGSSSGRLPTRSINTSHDFWLKDLQIFRFCFLFGKSYVFMFYLLVALCILFRLCSYVLVNLWSYNVHIMWRVKHTS